MPSNNAGQAFGAGGAGGAGSTAVDAVVLTVTFTVAAFVPSSVTEAGESVQVESNGAPAQESETACLNPLMGATLNE